MSDEEKQPLYAGDSDAWEVSSSDEDEDLYDRTRDDVIHESKRNSVFNNLEVPGGTLPNIMGTKFSSVVNPTFVDRHSLSSVQRKATRNSLIDPAVIAALPEAEVKKLSQKNALFKQLAMFTIGILVNGLAPIVEQYALYDPQTGRKNMTYILRTPFFFSYGLSCLIGLAAAGARYGTDGLQRCCYWKPIVLGMPVAIAYVFADWAGQKVQVDLDASLWKVMGQSKLMITAILAWVFLQQKQTATQWMLLVASSFAIAAYALIGISNVFISNWIIFGLAWLSIVGGCGGSIASEWLMKSYKDPFVVQMAQSRFASLLCTTICMVIEITAVEEWDRFPFGGWHTGVVLLVVSDLIKSWITTLLVRSMNSVWKSLAVAAALGVTYIAGCLFMTDYTGAQFDLRQFMLILAISMNIMTYAAAKRDQHKILQLRLDAEKHLNHDNKSSAV